MVHQSYSCLKLKGRTYYFSRRVPKKLQKHLKTDRVEVCLHTQLVSAAMLHAQLFLCDRHISCSQSRDISPAP